MESMNEIAEVPQYLTFTIAEEEYAVGILRVREIIQYEDVTKVPMTPPWIRGVMNLRGAVVPVVDLAVKFGLPESAVARTTCVVIVEVDLSGQATVMGIVADSVNQVIDLPESAVEPPPAFGTRVRVDYLVGMGKVGKGFVLILDIDRVLSTDELLATTAAIDEATQISAGEERPAAHAEAKREKRRTRKRGATGEKPPGEAVGEGASS
jgi:purine-binding chemotaxis protein CheW